MDQPLEPELHCQLFVIVNKLKYTPDNYHCYQHRQNELKKRFQQPWKFQSAAGVAFFKVFIKAPAPFCYTEKQEHKRTQRQQQIADNKIFNDTHPAVVKPLAALFFKSPVPEHCTFAAGSSYEKSVKE